MKYWTELSKIEDSVIRLSSLESLLRVIASGVPQTNLEDAENAIWYLAGSIEDIHKSLSEDFYHLWDVVRDESFDDERHKGVGGMKKKKDMTNKELP